LYSSAIDWSFDEEAHPMERKHRFVLLLVRLLLGDEVDASEDESTRRSDVAVDMWK